MYVPSQQDKSPKQLRRFIYVGSKKSKYPCVIGSDPVALLSPNTTLPGRQSKAALEVDLRGGAYFSDVPVADVVLVSTL